MKIKKLPRAPGVYLFKDAKDHVIYVGKAKNLNSRVRSYFQSGLDEHSKTAVLVKNIADIDFIEVMSEIESLVLEARLIKEYQPKFNILLKDDKTYLYIVIRNELSFPKIFTARKPDISAGDIVFGPYPESGTAKLVSRLIRKVFPYRDCSTLKYNKYAKLNSPCLYGHIGLCQAPCLGNISSSDYRKDINRIKKFLEGESFGVLRSIEKDMLQAAKKQMFEEAKAKKELLRKFQYVMQSYTSSDKYIDNPYLVEDLTNKSLVELVSNVKIVKAPPKRIECYDISNLSGKDAVGSMTVAQDGRLEKSEYRRFKIKLKDQPDDFEMIREMLIRRFNKKEWTKPDLVVVDGGKGQISAALGVLAKLGVSIPVIGLAKRFETVIYFDGNKFIEKSLDKNNEGLKLLQRLRDEAHRFAQKYHHILRLRRIKRSG